MKTLVLFDSAYGNTEKIAQAIGTATAAKVLRFADASPNDIKAYDFIFIGSPTQGGRPTQAAQTFLGQIATFKGMKMASFDTRVSARWVGIFGFAAGKIAENVKGKGAELMAPPEAFFVKGKSGPLKDGELERAAGWAKGLLPKK
jgi:flavodoxin I